MTTSVLDGRIDSDASLAAALAVGAGHELLALRRRAEAGNFADDAELRAAGDAAAQAFLARSLAEQRPGDAVLSEEAADDARRLTAERVWIVDPLDGTREFAERDPDAGWRDDFAVHVALWQRDSGLAAAAVAMPARDCVFRADAPPTLPAGEARGTRTPIRVAVSRTRPPAIATDLAARGVVELVPMGSAGVKTLAVVDGTVDAYLHAGGQYEWDTAAPVAIALAAGLIATRVDGTPLGFNQPRPWCPDLLVAAPAVHASLLAAIAARQPAPDLAVQPA